MNRIVAMVGLAAPNPNVFAGSSYEGHRPVFFGTSRENLNLSLTQAC